MKKFQQVLTMADPSESQTNDWSLAMRTTDYSHPNHLLASLMAAGSEHLLGSLEMVSLKFGDVLYESESRIRFAYFPTTSIVSLVYMMEDGATDEIAAVGNEGIIGVPLFMGSETTPSRAVVRCAGCAFRMKGNVLLEEFHGSKTVQQILLRYTQSLFAQISQTAACNRHHSVHQQLCRWLLSSLDRLPSNELKITHESIAGMLGVRRESVSKEAAELQSAGLIHNGRGRITVLDRRRLETRACECYRGIKREFGRLLSPQVPAPATFALDGVSVPRNVPLPRTPQVPTWTANA